MSHNDLVAIIPAGRYFVGDPGRVMKIGTFQDALEKADGRRNARVNVEDKAVVLMGAKPAIYPDNGIFCNSRYECESGKLGLVHEDLLINADIVGYAGSIVVVTGLGAVTIQDGVMNLRDDCNDHLVHIDTIGKPRQADVESDVKSLAEAA